MAFVMCPECKKKISAISENCIYCGYPLMSIRKNQLIDNILMDATIEQLNLSVRAYCALRNAEIKTVRDITALSMIQLIQIKGFGKKSLDEVLERLYRLGLYISDDYEGNLSDKINVSATKLDWNCNRAPKNRHYFSVAYKFSANDLKIIRKGRIPHSMENKWFCYYENGTIYFYRSWSGNLIYSLVLNEETNEHIAIVHYNEEKERDDLLKIDIMELIDCLLHHWPHSIY